MKTSTLFLLATITLVPWHILAGQSLEFSLKLEAEIKKMTGATVSIVAAQNDSAEWTASTLRAIYSERLMLAQRHGLTLTEGELQAMVRQQAYVALSSKQRNRIEDALVTWCAQCAEADKPVLAALSVRVQAAREKIEKEFYASVGRAARERQAAIAEYQRAQQQAQEQAAILKQLQEQEARERLAFMTLYGPGWEAQWLIYQEQKRAADALERMSRK